MHRRCAKGELRPTQTRAWSNAGVVYTTGGDKLRWKLLAGAVVASEVGEGSFCGSSFPFRSFDMVSVVGSECGTDVGE